MGKHKHAVSHVRLEFEHVSLWLPPEQASLTRRLGSICSSKKQHQQGKQLLNDVSGHALPGRMLAVMGPSGAGKTTLLGVLSGDRATLNSGKMVGRVLLGGKERNLSKFRRISAHVKQDDILLPTTTPREALQFAAALRLPTPHFTQQQQAAAVDRLIDGMKLEHCADTLVGDATVGMKGLSGGERRRLANAVELLGGPAVFLSDEPTSGQDSSTAVQVLQYMKHQINGAGGVLVITLHQPGSEVSCLIDDLLLLGYGGSPVFMGPWAAAMSYFTGHLGLHFPPHTGLADWLLALLDKEAHQQQLLQQQQQQQQRYRSKGGSSYLTGYTSSSGGSSSSSSLTISGGGHDCCKGSILLHARSGSSSSDATTATTSTTTASTSTCPHHHHQLAAAAAAAQNTMSAAWRKYAASGRAAAAAAPFLAAESATMLINPLSDLQGGLPGLSEIAEASSDDDADIIITTIVVDSAAEQSAGSVSSLQALPTPCSSSSRVGGHLAPLGVVSARGVARASLGVQIRVLSGRALLWWLRNPAMLLAEAGQYLFVVLFLGSLFPRLSTTGQAAAADRLAALYLWLTCIMVTTPARALLSWDQERRLLRHEMSSGLYSLTPFLIGTKLLVSLPLEVSVVAATGALLYFLLGLQMLATKFWAFMALSVFLAVCAANLGNAICLVMTNMHFKLPALCVTATLLLAFAGFVVQTIPVWWSWLGHASFCTYAYAGLVRNEFESLPLQLPLGAAAAKALSGPADAIRSSLAALGLNSLGAAAHALQGAAGSSGSNRTVVIDGLSMVPKTVNVHLFEGVGGYIGVLAAFALGSSVFVLLMTVLVVRMRRQ